MQKQCSFKNADVVAEKTALNTVSYHHEEYEEEKRILALANSNRTVSASERRKMVPRTMIYAPNTGWSFSRESVQKSSDTACIFHLNSLFINEKNEWIENQEEVSTKFETIG